MSKNEVENHNLSIDWTLNGGTLTSVTNQRDLKVGLRTDVDYIAPIFPLNTLNQQTKQSADNKIFFQELRYVAESVGNLNWLIGADYFSYENTEVIDQWFQPTVQPNSVFRDYRTDSTSWAYLAALSTLKNLPRLTGEIRYAQDNSTAMCWTIEPAIREGVGRAGLLWDRP